MDAVTVAAGPRTCYPSSHDHRRHSDHLRRHWTNVVLPLHHPCSRTLWCSLVFCLGSIIHWSSGYCVDLCNLLCEYHSSADESRRERLVCIAVDCPNREHVPRHLLSGAASRLSRDPQNR